MTEIDDAAVEKRAKKLCEENGTHWDVEVHSRTHGAKLAGTIDEQGKEEYRARARKQLLQECGE